VHSPFPSFCLKKMCALIGRRRLWIMGLCSLDPGDNCPIWLVLAMGDRAKMCHRVQQCINSEKTSRRTMRQVLRESSSTPGVVWRAVAENLRREFVDKEEV
jgi:hypothetical protein